MSEFWRASELDDHIFNEKIQWNWSSRQQCEKGRLKAATVNEVCMLVEENPETYQCHPSQHVNISTHNVRRCLKELKMNLYHLSCLQVGSLSPYWHSMRDIVTSSKMVQQHIQQGRDRSFNFKALMTTPFARSDSIWLFLSGFLKDTVYPTVPGNLDKLKMDTIEGVTHAILKHMFHNMIKHVQLCRQH